MNCVISSWPVKNPVTIAQGLMQGLLKLAQELSSGLPSAWPKYQAL